MSVRRKARRERRYGSADAWPSWTDEFRYVPTQDDADSASQLLHDGDEGDSDEQPPDAYYDEKAGGSYARSLMENGIRPF